MSERREDAKTRDCLAASGRRDAGAPGKDAKTRRCQLPRILEARGVGSSARSWPHLRHTLVSLFRCCFVCLFCYFVVVCLFLCWFLCLFVYTFVVCLFLCCFLCLGVLVFCLFVCCFVGFCVCLYFFVYLFLCCFLCLYFFVCLFMLLLFVCLSVCLSVCLFACLFLCAFVPGTSLESATGTSVCVFPYGQKESLDWWLEGSKSKPASRSAEEAYF